MDEMDTHASFNGKDICIDCEEAVCDECGEIHDEPENTAMTIRIEEDE
jgi:hypothetical protein